MYNAVQRNHVGCDSGVQGLANQNSNKRGGELFLWHSSFLSSHLFRDHAMYLRVQLSTKGRRRFCTLVTRLGWEAIVKRQ